MHYQVKSHKGGALLTALFIMTLVAIVATAMSMRLQLDIYRTRLTINHDKLYLASQAVTFWSMDLLSDGKNSFSVASPQGQVAQYPKNMERVDSEFLIQGELYDLQARFNLNSLGDKKALGSFIALQKNTQANQNNEQGVIASLTLFDWLSQYSLDKGKDALTSYYLKQQPPYLPSHQLMASTSELRLVKDINAAQYLALEPYIIALPEATPINLNTAPKPVLMSLGNGLNEARASELISARGDKGIKKLNDISELLKKLNLAEQVSIESKYFLSIAQVSNEEYSLRVYTVYKKDRDKDKKIKVGIVRVSVNSFQ